MLLTSLALGAACAELPGEPDQTAQREDAITLNASESLVTWTNAVGVAVSPTGLTKIASASSTNAGAASTQSIVGDGYVELTVGETNTYRTFGLSHGDDSPGEQDIDFALELQGTGGLVAIYEFGTWRGAIAYATGDKLRISVTGGVVRYSRNGVAFYTSSMTPTFPLLVDTSLYTPNATLSNVVISGDVRAGEVPVVWTNLVGVSASGDSLTKTAATEWGNAGASSVQVLNGDGYVELTVGETGTYRTIGLSRGDADQSEGDIDFALEFQGTGGLVAIYDYGVWKGAIAYATGDHFRIAVTAGVVAYLKNGVAFYTSSATPSFPLLVDTALYATGATLENVVLSRDLRPGERAVEWTNVVGATAQGNRLVKTAPSGSGNAGATSTQHLPGDGYVEVTVGETNTYRLIGLSNGDSNQEDGDVDYAFELQGTGGLAAIRESGVFRGAVSYAANDKFRVRVLFGVVRYEKNGTAIYTSSIPPKYPLVVDSALYTSGATLNNAVVYGFVAAGEAPVTWSRDVGVAITLSNLRKTGSGSGWGFAGASSTQAITGDGYVELVAWQDGSERAFGLSHEDSNLDRSDIDFSFDLRPTASTGIAPLSIYENGTKVAQDWSYVSGDRLRIAVQGGVVTYLKNGIPLYVTLRTPSFPLLVDTAFADEGGTLSDVVLSTHEWHLEPGTNRNDTESFDGVAGALHDGDLVELGAGTFHGRLRLHVHDGVTVRGAGTATCPDGIASDPVGPAGCTIITSESWNAVCPPELLSEVCDTSSTLTPACQNASHGKYSYLPQSADTQTLLLDGMTNATVEQLSIQNSYFVGYHGGGYTGTYTLNGVPGAGSGAQSSIGQGCTISTAVRIDSGGTTSLGAAIDRWSIMFNNVDIRSSGKDTVDASRAANGGDQTHALNDVSVTMSQSTLSGGYFIYSANFDDPCTSNRTSTATFNDTVFHASMPTEANHPMFNLYGTNASYLSCSFYDDNDTTAHPFLFDNNAYFYGHHQKAIFSAHACTDPTVTHPVVEIAIANPRGNLATTKGGGWLDLFLGQQGYGAHVTITGATLPSGVDLAPFFANDPGYNGNAADLARFGDVQHESVTRFPPDATVRLASCTGPRGDVGPGVLGTPVDSMTSGSLYQYQQSTTRKDGVFPLAFGAPTEPALMLQVWRPEAFFRLATIDSSIRLLQTVLRAAADVSYTDRSCSGLGCTPVADGAAVGCGAIDRTWFVTEHRVRTDGVSHSQTYVGTQRITFTN